MSCKSFDWKAYALGELDRPARQEAEAHAAGCVRCREELAALRLTLDALSALREEEIPQRIAFVSDKVFEPKWWQKGVFATLFSPNFAAACVIAAAILVHGFARPHTDDAQTQAQINAAVAKAVMEVEARYAEQLRAADARMTDMYMTTTGLVRQ